MTPPSRFSLHRPAATPPLGPRLTRLLALAAAALCLHGCGGDHDELRQWMDEQRRAAKPSVPPLEAPKKFSPQEYAGNGGADPFSTQKLTIALKQEARQPSSLIAPEANRRKEPLEAFPLDDMTMVGSLVKQGRAYALLRVGGLLYQVKTGDRLGQNYGKITRISETEVQLREIVQDAVGEWIERPATLQLQEKAQ